MSDYLDANNEELLKDFFAEAEQQVENLESNILVIENDPSNHDAIDEIFRAAHTLKGGSATVEMTELSTFCHDVEDLLDALRSGTVAVSEPIVDVLLTAIDTIKAMLDARNNGSVYQNDVSPLVEKIQSFIPAKSTKKKTPVPKPASLINTKPAAPSTPEKASPAPVSTAPVSVSAAPQMPPVVALSEYELLELKEACPEGTKLWSINVLFDESNLMNSVGGIQVFAALKAKGSVLKTVPDFDALYEDEFHPQVVYYIASNATQDELEDTAFLNDVTLCCDAKCMEQDALAALEGSKDEPISESTSAAVVQSADEPESKNEQSASAEQSDSEEEDAASADVTPATTASVQQAKKSLPATGHQVSQAGSILRVDSKRIDYLLNLVSETVITKAAFNQIGLHMGDLQVQLQNLDQGYKEKIHRLFDDLPKYFEDIQNGGSIKDVKQHILDEYNSMPSWFDGFDNEFKSIASKYRSSTQNLGRIASELQEGVMKIRMVPISQIFSRFPRVVRDLSRDLNRKVNLVIEGEDTELDKAVIEDLLDPIMHCVRNSVDHGIEPPEVRIAAGKPEEGTLLLKASNEGNMIIIDIADDGAGIDVEKVRAKAIQKGLIHPSKILTDQEAYNLIFLPGFSTSDKITSVSGRGVGLDVVKTMIDKLNGTVSVSSERGKGSKFSIRLPLTMAIIQGLLVRVGKETYSIPIANVIESQRVKQEDISTIDNYEVLNVRNEVISILRLSRLFNIKNISTSDYSFIVIVGSQEKKIGVMVDALVGEEDVVIKPLHDQFTSSPGIAGASILGDGSVSLIIDVSQLLELGVRQELSAQRSREAEAVNAAGRGN